MIYPRQNQIHPDSVESCESTPGMFRRNTLAELRWMIGASRPPRLRTMREFAEQEIVPPTGPAKDMLFRADRQPFTGLLLDEIDRGDWWEIAITGPSQTGKSLVGFVIPILYHLFELREAVILGCTDMGMAKDKWDRDLLPVIQRTRYRSLLPRRGGGSRGGFSETMTMQNGAVLKIMTGGGEDKSRAYFTARVVVFTEVDGLATSASTSDEADKIKQIEARTEAYGERKRIYKECTVTVPQGHIWTTYQRGTASRIMLPCPYCGGYFSPEFDQLRGWQDADNDVQALNRGHFVCGSCEHPWTEADRKQANLAARVVHRGQTIDTDGTIHGEPPATRTLGFRWNAANNLLVQAGYMAAKEWAASQEPDEDNAEKARCQFRWARPYVSGGLEVVRPDAEQLKRRIGHHRKGVLPANTEWLTLGIDIGKRLGHWTLIAFLRDHTAHIADYGIFEIDSDQLGVARALKVALREFRDNTESGGWPLAESQTAMVPHATWVDCGWQKEKRGQADAIYEFLAEPDTDPDRWKGTIGRGRSQVEERRYSQPSRLNNTVRYIGESFFIEWVPAHHLFRVVLNVDDWKMKVHERLMLPTVEGVYPAGSMTLYTSADRNEHLKFGKHIAAEHREEEYVPGEGEVTVFKRDRRQNHWLDSTVLASAAGSFCGFVTEPATHAGDQAEEIEDAGLMPAEPPDDRPFVFASR